jgi:hypothetical protein
MALGKAMVRAVGATAVAALIGHPRFPPTVVTRRHGTGYDSPGDKSPDPGPTGAVVARKRVRSGFLGGEHLLHRVKDHVRDGLLERIDRDGATVGQSIPESLSVGERTIDLRAFVRAASDGDRDPEAVQSVIVGLRRERERRRERLESDSLSREAGRELADSILGIDRALTVLESAGEPDIEAEIERKRVADRKRWHSFLEEVTGDETGREENP